MASARSPSPEPVAPPPPPPPPPRQQPEPEEEGEWAEALYDYNSGVCLSGYLRGVHGVNTRLNVRRTLAIS